MYIYAKAPRPGALHVKNISNGADVCILVACKSFIRIFKSPLQITWDEKCRLSKELKVLGVSLKMWTVHFLHWHHAPARASKVHCLRLLVTFFLHSSPHRIAAVFKVITKIIVFHILLVLRSNFVFFFTFVPFGFLTF